MNELVLLNYLSTAELISRKMSFLITNTEYASSKKAVDQKWHLPLLFMQSITHKIRDHQFALFVWGASGTRGFGKRHSVFACKYALFWGKCEYDGCSSKRTIIISFIFIWGAAAGVDSNNEAAVGTSNQLSKCKIVIIMLDSMASVNLLLSHSDCMRAWEIGREGERCSTEF